MLKLFNSKNQIKSFLSSWGSPAFSLGRRGPESENPKGLTDQERRNFGIEVSRGSFQESETQNTKRAGFPAKASRRESFLSILRSLRRSPCNPNIPCPGKGCQLKKPEPAGSPALESLIREVFVLRDSSAWRISQETSGGRIEMTKFKEKNFFFISTSFQSKLLARGGYWYTKDAEGRKDGKIQFDLSDQTGTKFSTLSRHNPLAVYGVHGSFPNTIVKTRKEG